MSILINDNTIKTMYDKQYQLQHYMVEKRNLQEPPAQDSNYITHEHVLAAIYFASCINIEWMELEEVYREYVNIQSNISNENNEDYDPQLENILRIKALEELIDVFHFILSVFIFLGLKESQVLKIHHFSLGGISSLSEYAGETALAISSVLAEAPYKTWKDQDNTKEITPEYADLLFSKFVVCFNNVLDFAEYCLDSNYDEFVKVYLIKNALNFKRQEDKNLGYIQEG